jgi:hypothetical protein
MRHCPGNPQERTINQQLVTKYKLENPRLWGRLMIIGLFCVNTGFLFHNSI